MKIFDVAKAVHERDDAAITEAAAHILDNWKDYSEAQIVAAAQVAFLEHPSRKMRQGQVRQLMRAIGPIRDAVSIV